ncbi:MAG: rod shape-determining protein MreC [Nitrospirae bacterium]|nr:rod shape-determining protein MreC [Nitrospirota bacterium]
MILKKVHTLFTLYFVVTVSLMSYQSMRGPLSPLYFFRYPINYVNSGLSFFIESIKKPFVATIAMERDNERLRSELKRLQLKEQRFEQETRENKRLEGLLSLKNDIESGGLYRYVATARVISKNPDSWSHLMVINRGLEQGVKKDMAVRTVEGLIGKVIMASARQSTVLLITDIHSSVAIKIDEKRLEGILSGTGDANCILKYLPEDEDVAIGSKVVTSGFDALFPPGIPVGKVESVDKTTAGLFLNVEVELFANPVTMDEVMVVSRVDEKF